MCVEVCVQQRGGDIWCDTQGQLTKALGRPLVFCAGYGGEADGADVCLCPVDIAASAAKAGMESKRWGWDDEHMGEWVISPPPTASGNDPEREVE